MILKWQLYFFSWTAVFFLTMALAQSAQANCLPFAKSYVSAHEKTPIDEASLSSATYLLRNCLGEKVSVGLSRQWSGEFNHSQGLWGNVNDLPEVSSGRGIYMCAEYGDCPDKLTVSSGSALFYEVEEYINKYHTGAIKPDQYIIVPKDWITNRKSHLGSGGISGVDVNPLEEDSLAPDGWVRNFNQLSNFGDSNHYFFK